LIGPWGPSVLTAPNTDSITLTYSVSAQQQVPTEALDAARQAASDWAAWVSSHDGSGTFTIEQAVGGTPTVPITIKNGGGVIAGKTKLTLDKQGLIKAASMQISGSNQGLENDPDTVYEITLHELGHAFIGLNHSDDPTDLMYPILNGSMSIGTCEENGSTSSAWLMDGMVRAPSPQQSVQSAASDAGAIAKAG
jgi:hypothetical protein